jgi:hypothetical protein
MRRFQVSVGGEPMRRYQSEPGRLARLFKASREKWRANAAEKQKKVRKLEIRVRDLEISREKWKARAQAAEREVAEHRRAGSQARPSEEDSDRDSKMLMPLEGSGPSLERAWGHRYPLWLVQMALYLVLVALTSFRGASRSLAGLAEVGWAVAEPSAGGIRLWALRAGLYELRRRRPPGREWILIVDLSIQLGAAKVLVIVAVPRARLPAPVPARPTPAEGFPAPAAAEAPSAALSHQDVEVVGLKVLSHSTGEVVKQHVAQAAEALNGPVVQIVSDHGSDVKKGIERYRQAHPQTRSSWDVSHAMALLLKHELEADERFSAFLKHGQEARQALQQTRLSFLRPPAWRRKGRWLQVGVLIAWALETLRYAERGDFSLIDPVHSLDAHTYRRLIGELEPALLRRLDARLWRDYPHQAAFLEAMEAHLGADVVARHRPVLCPAADRGRRRFEEVLGWLGDFRTEIGEYGELIEAVQLTQQLLKTQGLNTHSPQHLAQAFAQHQWNARAEHFIQGIQDYLQHQTQDLPEGQNFLATSDVIESLFGHYKRFAERAPLDELGSLILTLPLRTVKLTAAFVKKALETVSTADFWRWSADTFSPSAMARRVSALGRQKTTKNQHEEGDTASA